MNWQDDFLEGCKTGKDNHLSLGLVMLTIVCLLMILAGLLIIACDTPAALTILANLLGG